MMPQLSPDQLRQVLAIVAVRLPSTKVMVFGSRARGSARPSSDLDLLVDVAEPLDDVTLAHLQQDFVDSDLPFRVEVLDGARVDAGFRSRIAPDLLMLAGEGSSPSQPPPVGP